MSAPAPLSVLPPDRQEKLESWKEIAAFLRRGVRTVQRWEQTEDLPIRRHLHERGGTVYAYKSEILEWYRARQTRLETQACGDEPLASEALPPQPLPASPLVAAHVPVRPAGARRRVPLLAITAAFLVCVTAAASWYLLRDSRPRTTLATTLLSVVGRASQSVLSHDGQRVAFAWNGEGEFGNLDLYVKRVGSDPPQRLTDAADNEHSPAWSTDGTKLAYLRDNGGVFVVKSGGGVPERLAKQRLNSLYGVGMSWSLDGKHLYFSERRVPGEPMSLYQLSVEDGSEVRLTAPREGAGDMYPAVAPEGHRLMFVRQSANYAADIYLLRLGQIGRPPTEPERLTFQSSRIAGLDWLPDGRSIVFSSDHSGGRRLWMLRLGSPGRDVPEPLAFAGEEAFQPSVAKATRQHVAYSRRYWPTAIWRIELTRSGLPAGAPVKLIGSARQDLEPVWSPDARRIAFVSTRTGYTEIWVSEWDGSRATQLTSFGGPRTQGPAWSPEGQRLAFSSGSERNSSIFVTDAAGGSPRRLTPVGMHAYQPLWSRDGQRLYFTSDQSGGAQIWSVPASGGLVRRVTRDGGTHARLSVDGQWLFYHRGGIWRMPAAGGDAQQIVESPVGSFAVDERRIYFDRGFGDYAAPEIYFRDLAGGGSSTLLTRLDRRKAAGLSVSADGRTLLLPLNDRQSSELVLVRGSAENSVQSW